MVMGKPSVNNQGRLTETARTDLTARNPERRQFQKGANPEERGIPNVAKSAKSADWRRRARRSRSMGSQRRLGLAPFGIGAVRNSAPLMLLRCLRCRRPCGAPNAILWRGGTRRARSSPPRRHAPRLFRLCPTRSARMKTVSARDPDQIHHAHREQQRHERPATAQAVHAVPKSHLEGAARALSPMTHEEVHRRPAMLEARVS